MSIAKIVSCEKCAYNVESYKARCCNKCEYPKVEELNDKNKMKEINPYDFEICQICDKYNTAIIHFSNTTDFFKIDFNKTDRIRSYTYNESDSDSDSDFDCHSDCD